MHMRGSPVKRYTSLSMEWALAKCGYAYSGRSRVIAMLQWPLSVRVSEGAPYATGYDHRNGRRNITRQIIVETCVLGFRTKRRFAVFKEL